MNRLSLALAALAALAASSAYAFAEEPTTDWSGVFLGLSGGYGSASANWEFPAPGWFNTLPGSFSTNPTGALVGARVAINRQMDSMVFGLEGTAEFGTLSHTVFGPLDPTYPNDKFTATVTDLETITGRLGFASGHWLLYGKAGIATGTVNLAAIDGPPFNSGITLNANARLFGWTVGAGVEKQLPNNIVLGLDASYASLGGTSIATATSQVPPVPTTVNVSNVGVASVVGRISVKIGK